jgi:uncharacterized membrane protein YfcA
LDKAPPGKGSGVRIATSGAGPHGQQPRWIHIDHRGCLGLGAAIGVLLGLLGGGGSIVAVPALVYVLGLHVQQSIPVRLIVVGAGAAVGVGGGFLIISAPVLLLGVEMPMAVGTSLLIIVANSMAALVSHLGGADINWATTAAFAGGAIAASLVFGHVGTKVDTGRLQHWFAYLVFAVAAYVLIDTIVFQRL